MAPIKPCNFTISIYTIQGQRIWSYKKNNIEKGKYQISWNGINGKLKSPANGVYIAYLSTGETHRQISFVLH